MGAEWRTGSMSAWLLKKKSGSSMVRVRQYNKRYFTIDFDSHVFFYSHAEGSKKVSSVIRFADIVDVVLPDPGPDKSSQSRGSSLRRSFSFGNSTSKEGGEQAHYFVTVVVRPSKTMELLCSSATEATQWFQAFKEAMLFGKDDGDDVGMGYGGTSGEETETAELKSAVAPPPGKSVAHSPVATSGGYPVASSGGNPTSAGYPMPAPAVTSKAVAAATTTTAATPLLAAREDPPEEAQPEEPVEARAAPVEAAAEAPVTAPEPEPANLTEEAAAAPDAQAEPEPVAPLFGKAAREAAASAANDIDNEAEPPKTKGTFLDFGMEVGAAEEIGGSAEAGAAGAGKSGASAKPAAVDEIIETKGQIMQASDFGFGVDEDTESSGSAVSTPRVGDRSAFAGPGGLSSLPELDDGSPAVGKTPAGKDSDGASPSRLMGSPGAEGGARSYGDRHEGLSMQERLANLEFSDCESDDDDPLGLGTAKGGAR